MRTMDLIALHEKALRATGKIVAGVRPEQLDAPTPCSEWDVRALLNHVIGGNWLFVDIAAGGAFDPNATPPDFTAGDVAAAYEESAKAVAAAWGSPELLGKTVRMPIGDVPGQVALSLHFMDKVVHGWDLAKATGQDLDFADDLVEPVYEFVQNAVPDDFRGPGKPFGPRVEAPEGAGTRDRLVAFLGRQP